MRRKEVVAAAAQNIRKTVLRPGLQQSEIDAMLYGELGTNLNWIERQADGRIGQTKTPAAMATGVSVSVVAGARRSGNRASDPASMGDVQLLLDRKPMVGFQT
jgi:hypothetical protein